MHDADANRDGMVSWQENVRSRSAVWRSSSGARPPGRVEVVDERLGAQQAVRNASQGVGMLWRGDFAKARSLLTRMRRRVDRKPAEPAADPAAAFYRYRQARKNRARVLGMVLVQLDADFSLRLPRAPDVRAACRAAYGENTGPCVVALRDLLGALSARQWYLRGVYVPALGARIHPHYGVFVPTRNEYLDLLADADLRQVDTAFDIGTGTGVLAAMLAKAGAARVVATDSALHVVACARENIERLGLAKRVAVTQTDLFPPGRADLVVCNPPWLPASPSSSLDAAVFDASGRMLSGFLRGARQHLAPAGEAWLVLSNLAELLGLRTRAELLDQFADAGLAVRARWDTQPRHPRATNPRDPLAVARCAEQVSLWRLGPT